MQVFNNSKTGNAFNVCYNVCNITDMSPLHCMIRTYQKVHAYGHWGSVELTPTFLVLKVYTFKSNSFSFSKIK